MLEVVCSPRSSFALVVESAGHMLVGNTLQPPHHSPCTCGFNVPVSRIFILGWTSPGLDWVTKESLSAVGTIVGDSVGSSQPSLWAGWCSSLLPCDATPLWHKHRSTLADLEAIHEGYFIQPPSMRTVDGTITFTGSVCFNGG
ncbi:unnamed protein product [Ostreobium quekettii]|uniref:Uncharacterized protein n=1 Tax=Ostreobium quekettii TaxID=121088 RepID=A0A8S1IWC4_9CHLO|nr:unnamed protein product [Ostreobium quekettii]